MWPGSLQPGVELTLELFESVGGEILSKLLEDPLELKS